jgi:hypothetical protein
MIKSCFQTKKNINKFIQSKCLFVFELFKKKKETLLKPSLQKMTFDIIYIFSVSFILSLNITVLFIHHGGFLYLVVSTKKTTTHSYISVHFGFLILPPDDFVDVLVTFLFPFLFTFSFN